MDSKVIGGLSVSHTNLLNIVQGPWLVLSICACLWKHTDRTRSVVLFSVRHLVKYNTASSILLGGGPKRELCFQLIQKINDKQPFNFIDFSLSS